MATTIGFKRASFYIYNAKDEIDTNIHKDNKKPFVVEGAANQGGTVEASISGLSAESKKTYASNVAYYVAQRGTGSVELSLSVLDMPEELTKTLLGRKEVEGLTYVGDSTEPPYAGVLLESNALNGEPVFFALLKGKFRLDEQNLSTNEDEVSDPEPDELEGQFVADINGNVFVTAKGEANRKKMQDLFGKIATKDEKFKSSKSSSDTGASAGNTDRGNTHEGVTDSGRQASPSPKATEDSESSREGKESGVAGTSNEYDQLDPDGNWL